MFATNEQNATLVEIFKRGNQLTYKKGEFVIRPSQVPPGVFFIESGLVKAYDITKYGEENMLIIRKEGEIFPLIWAITGQERQIIYQAIVPTVLRQISHEQFNEYLSDSANAIRPLLDMAVEMYRIHSERLLNLEYRSVRERLISFLLTMSRRFGTKNEDGILIEVPLRHQDIASSINSSRETTTRSMAYLEQQGLVSNKNLFITLKDVNKLRSYL